MKPYIDILFEKKSYYKSIGDIGMSNTFKILAGMEWKQAFDLYFCEN